MADPSVGSSGRVDPAQAEFLADVVAGLSASPKTLPCKYFYDEVGSRLFDQITDLPEYYLTRTEVGVLEANLDQIAERLGRGAVLVEYGSGSSVKTRLLLEGATDLAAYVPIDISREHLLATAVKLRHRYPSIPVIPVVADYGSDVALPADVPDGTRTAFFPGSTIGNFAPDEAVEFLQRIAKMLGKGGGLLIGVDLAKDRETLEAAYDDAARVTADFNRNLLVRINRELGGNFPLDDFQHRAIWNPEQSRVEMHLVSQKDLIVRLGDRTFDFAKGESIWTESSHKFTLEQFEDIAARAGYRVEHVWTDERSWFSVQYLRVAG